MSKRKTVILENDPHYKEKKEWANKFRHLLGKRIVGVRYLTKEETEASAWYSSPIAIELDDGSALIPQQDDEGNDGGAMAYIGEKANETFPVLGVDDE